MRFADERSLVETCTVQNSIRLHFGQLFRMMVTTALHEPAAQREGSQHQQSASRTELARLHPEIADKPMVLAMPHNVVGQHGFKKVLRFHNTI